MANFDEATLIKVRPSLSQLLWHDWVSFMSMVSFAVFLTLSVLFFYFTQSLQGILVAFATICAIISLIRVLNLFQLYQNADFVSGLILAHVKFPFYVTMIKGKLSEESIRSARYGTRIFYEFNYNGTRFEQNCAETSKTFKWEPGRRVTIAFNPKNPKQSDLLDKYR